MSDQSIPYKGITALNCLSVMLWGILPLASADIMSAEVELLAVVWEVRESKAFSPLLSSSPEIESEGERSVNEEALSSAGVGLTCGSVVLFRATLGGPSHLRCHSSLFLLFLRVCDSFLHCLTFLPHSTSQGQ